MSTLSLDRPPTKKALLEFVRDRIRNDERWATRGLIRIYENQTQDERQSHDTKDHNGIGFTAFDAEFLSSCAEAYQRYRRLSPARMVHVQAKMVKYAAQLIAASDPMVLERAWRKSLSVPAPATQEFYLQP